MIPSLDSDPTIVKRDTRPKKDKIFKTATIVDDDTPVSKLNHYIEGSSWTVDYFNQVKAENDLTSRFDEFLPDSLQQYSLIKNLELKIQSPIDVGNVESSNGSAVIAVGISPQSGDLFYATLVDGRKAILVITEVTKKNYNLNLVFEVSFKIDSFTDINTNRYDDLLTKVVKNFYFDSNYILTESAPILLKSDYEFKKLIEREVPHLTEYFFKECLDLRSRMLLIPGQTIKTLDPLLESFIFKIIDFSGSQLIGMTRRVSNEIPINLHETIWGVLLSGDGRFLESTLKEFTLVNRRGEIANNNLNSLLISNTHHPLRDVKVPINTLPVFEENDFTYLFTSNFFNRIEVENLSTIEKLVLRYIDNDVLGRSDMEILINSYMYWDPLEKYYYIPVLILLLKAIIKKTHSII